MNKKNLQSKQNLFSKANRKIFPAVLFFLLGGPNSETALVWAKSPQAPASHKEITLAQNNAPQSPGSSAQLNASSQSNTAAQQGKAKIEEIKHLVADYFPRAKIELLKDTLKVTYKAKNGISVYTQREELMPEPDGLICSISIKAGPYSGKESLNLTANQFYYSKLTLAPYLEAENNHLLAQLSYGARVPVEFIQQFKSIVNAYAPTTTEAASKKAEDTGSQSIAPVNATNNQQTPAGISANNSASKTEAKQDKLFLWKAVRGNDTVYLLGTIHVAKRDFYPLPRGILDAFQSSNHLLVEADITDAAFVKLLETTREKTSGLYKTPDRLRDKLKPETKKVFESYLQWAGESWEMYDKYKPWLATEIIGGSIPRRGELTQFKGRYGIDLFLLNQAKKNDVKVSSLEPPERELIFAQMPDAAADARLLALLLELKDQEKEMNNIFKIWRSGDYRAMEEKDREAERRVPDLRQFHKVLLDDRNLAMVAKLLQLMPKQKGPHFVAVGSAHMGGETGLVEQLKKHGFTVEQMDNRIAPASFGLELSKVKDNFQYAPGPCLERRQNLYKIIQACKEKGIGITGYMNSFLEIEKGITQRKMNEGAISAEINRIEMALSTQVSPLKQHIITPYCIQIEKLLAQKLPEKLKILTKDCILSCSIDEGGKLLEVKASEEDKSPPAIRAQAVQILQSVGTLTKPPQSPLKLKILLSRNLNNVEAWYRGVVDHDQFMINVRKKVLAKWHVTNIKSATETTITFVVKRDGSIENIRFLKSSGSPEAEEAAIMAVQGAAPFQNLPDGSRKREQITFSFETQE